MYFDKARQPGPGPTETILEEAERIVTGPRRDDYGTPLENHTRTAELWSSYLSQKFPGIKLSATDVCFLNILQKISRVATTGKVSRDALVDIAGYARNIEMIQQAVEAVANGDSLSAVNKAMQSMQALYSRESITET